MSKVVQFPGSAYKHQYQQADVRFDTDLNAAFLYMQPTPRPCFTEALLRDIQGFQQQVAEQVRLDLASRAGQSLSHMVFASASPGIYNFGGDLATFIRLIRAGDRAGLQAYTDQCLRVVHNAATGLDLPLTSVALVQGRAQGGGFEAALACHVVIAERGSQLGFPEVLFNLFPGMGAYSFLSRRVSPALAERLILSGKLYDAEELYELGAIDVLAEPGQGAAKLREYLVNAERRSNAHAFSHYLRTHLNRVPYEELREIGELWVDSALRLTEREIKTMERLVRAQDRRQGTPSSSTVEEPRVEAT